MFYTKRIVHLEKIVRRLDSENVHLRHKVADLEKVTKSLDTRLSTSYYDTHLEIHTEYTTVGRGGFFGVGYDTMYVPLKDILLNLIDELGWKVEGHKAKTASFSLEYKEE